MSTKKELNGKYGLLRIEEDILYCRFREGLVIDRTIAKAMVEERLAFTNYQPMPTVITFNASKTTKAAREYVTAEGLIGLTAGAFVVESEIQRFFVNFYLSVYRPKIPARLFTSIEDATLWIQEFKT